MCVQGRAKTSSAYVQVICFSKVRNNFNLLFTEFWLNLAQWEFSRPPTPVSSFQLRQAGSKKHSHHNATTHLWLVSAFVDLCCSSAVFTGLPPKLWNHAFKRIWPYSLQEELQSWVFCWGEEHIDSPTSGALCLLWHPCMYHFSVEPAISILSSKDWVAGKSEPVLSKRLHCQCWQAGPYLSGSEASTNWYQPAQSSI